MPTYAEDRAAIEDLFARYARGCDARDWPAVADCFTPEAQAEYSGVRLPSGVTHILSHLAALAKLAASQHVIGSVTVTVTDDRAEASSYAVAHLVRSIGEGHDVVHRGLHYEDQLVRTPAGWRIKDRVHRVVWSTTSSTIWPVPRFTAAG